MRSLGRILNRLSTLSAAIGGIAVILMMLQIVVDVLLKNLFTWPVPLTANLVTKWYMVAAAFLPLALTEILDRNVAVEVLFQHLTRRWKRILGGAVCLLSAGIAGLMVVPLWDEAMKRMAAGSFIVENGDRLSVWEAYFFLPVGFGLFALVLLYRTVILWTGAESGLDEVPIDTDRTDDDITGKVHG